MARLCAGATGNLTSAATWKTIDATTYNNTEASSGAAPTASGSATSRLATGQTPGAITIDAIAIKIAQRNGTTGTMTVSLFNVTGSAFVTGATCTINVADLPAISSATALDGGWHVFKFAAPVSLSAATAYAVDVTTSTAAQVTIFKSATGGDWARFLRTTTTAAPAAADDMIVAGEYTGAGTSNSYTVTMDSTAATAYGAGLATSYTTPALSVCNKGTLTYGTTASTNYILRLAGSLFVYRGGTLNIGTAATPIPGTGSAVLEFQQLSADGDYGLFIRDGGTLTSRGSPRTAGKLVVNANLSGGGAIGTTGGALRGFTGTTTSGSAILSAVSSTNIDPFTKIAVGDQIGINNAVTPIPAGVTILGWRDASGNNFGTTTGLTANSQILMSANAIASGTSTNTVYTNAFQGAKTLTVDTDTGWLSGDMIAVAPTTNLPSDGEAGALTANATATQLATQGWVNAATDQVLPLAGTGGLLHVHDGFSPVQAEVILLTRNIKIRSTSNTLQAYVAIGPYAAAASAITADVQWTEFYYLGTFSVDKRGVESNTIAGSSITFRYCSFHDSEGSGIYLAANGGTADGVTVSNNVMWNLGGAGVTFFSASTASNWTLDSNIVIHAGSAAFGMADIGGTFTNNRAIGCSSQGILAGESAAATFGSWSGNIAHSNQSSGLQLATSPTNGVISSTTLWRNNSQGLLIGAANADLTFNGLTVFGNGVGSATTNIASSFSCTNLKFINAVVSGDAAYQTTVGLILGASNVMEFTFDGGSFSAVSGIKVAHTTADISFSTSPAWPRVLLRGTTLGAATPVAGQSFFGPTSYVSAQEMAVASHKTWRRDGTISSDSTIYKTASPSERLTPNSLNTATGNTASSSTVTITANMANCVVGRFVSGSGIPADTYITAVSLSAGTITLSNAATATANGVTLTLCAQLLSGSKLVAIASGASSTIGVYVRKSVVGDGTAYVGASPRLIQKANSAVGITADTVRGTLSGGSGAFAQITYAITNSSGDDAVFEFCVDASGSAGWINVDDWSVT